MRDPAEATWADPAGTAACVARPATRDMVRLLRSEQRGTPSMAHNFGLAVRLREPTTLEQLDELLAGVSARHAALRTAVVTDAEHGRRLEVAPPPLGGLLRWSSVSDGTDVGRRLRELMEPPFDPARPPLWRFEMLEFPSGDQVLIYGAHHVVSDLQSLMLTMAELDAGLDGTEPETAAPSDRDVDLLLEAQRARRSPGGGPAAAGPAGERSRPEFAGCRRLEPTLAAPRPPERSFRAGTMFLELPDGLTGRLTAAARRSDVTPSAFCLGVLSVLLARLRGVHRFVLAVPVDSRLYVRAPSALGFFGVPVPFVADVPPGEPILDVLRRTNRRLKRLLGKGASLFDAMPALVEQGLYRPDAPLVEVYFNHIRMRNTDPRVLELLPYGTGYSDLDLMVTMLPDLGLLRLDHNLDIIEEQACARFGHDYLGLLAEAADDTGQAALPSPALAVPTTAARDAARTTQARGSVALAAGFALGDLPDLLGTALAGERPERTDEPDETPPEILEAPYHHVLAGLWDPDGVFARPDTVAGVVLLRAADLTRFGSPGDEELADLAEEYATALDAAVERRGIPLVVGFPPSRDSDRAAWWERELIGRLEGRPGIAVLRPGDWDPGQVVADPFDEETERLAHLPYRPEFQAVLALTLADTLRALLRPAPKVIAVDGDQTLWSGVAGEVGPDRVDLTGSYALFARRLLDWRAAGTLLVLVSNNDHAILRGVLERPDGTLRAEHFAAIAAGWDPKPKRLRAAVDELGLGTESVLFLDDNPAEIAAMRADLPEVLSVTVPPAPELAGFLARLWPAVPRAATAEDTARADFYRHERARRAERERTGFAEFLASLRLEVRISPLSDETIRRSVQLCRRTNQFNLRPAELDEVALRRWQLDGEVWTATARDRFGDYGLVGVLVLRADGDVLEVMAWLLSCRALGRGVEERMLSWLADRAEALGCQTVRLVAEHTPRNTPARRLVAALDGADPEATRLSVSVPPSRLRSFRSWEQPALEDREADRDR